MSLILRQGKNIIVQDKRDISFAMQGGENSKTLRRVTLQEELMRTADCGCVNVMTRTTPGFKKVEVNILLHNSYVTWLFDNVYPSLESSDASESANMRQWHRVLDWEIHLTSRMRMAGERVILDVHDGFSLNEWIEGFASFDLDVLSCCPGVDADRRILRLIAFAELAFKATIEAIDAAQQTSAHSEGQAVPLASVSNAELRNFEGNTEADMHASQTCKSTVETYEVGEKVIVRTTDNADSALYTGMEGRVAGIEGGEEYKVRFANLADDYIINGDNLLPAQGRVPREQKACKICGSVEHLSRCQRCHLVWYCSTECQKSDWKTHKEACKLFSSKASFPFVEQMDQQMFRGAGR